jgi:trimethylamine--corrinoid protein Co-methyltransferase
MWAYVMRMSRGIEVSDDSMSVETIHQVGPGGLFLKHRDTLSHFRKELWLPTLGQRESYEDWSRAGGKGFLDRAAARAEQLSSLPTRNPLPTDVEKELERLFESEVRRH